MESTTDFEKLLFLYKTEDKNMSIESFCVNNGINYRAFDKWYRNTHKNIVPVQIIDGPESNEAEVYKESKKDVKEVEHNGHDYLSWYERWEVW